MSYMKDNIFIDSNIWVYFASNNKSDKKLKSFKIINYNFSKINISTQFLGELFNVLKKKPT